LVNQALRQFEVGEALTEWLELYQEKESPTMLPTDDLMMTTHWKILNVASAFLRNTRQLPSLADGKKISQQLKEINSFLQILVRDREKTPYQSTMATILTAVVDQLETFDKQSYAGQEVPLSFVDFVPGAHSSDVLLGLKVWTEFLSKFKRMSAQTTAKYRALTLEVARQARKEGNHRLASQTLQTAMKGANPISATMTDFLRSILGNAFHLNTDSVALWRQCTKLCFNEDPNMAVSVKYELKHMLSIGFYFVSIDRFRLHVVLSVALERQPSAVEWVTI
jgi:hypothetical protein